MSMPRKTAWLMWLIVSLFYAYQYILRVMPSIILEDVMRQFSMDSVVFGQFSGIYYIGYSLVHIPVGIMMDKYGPRRVMSVCILLTAFGMTPLIFASHWMTPIVGRVIVGIGSSASVIGLFKIVRMAFEEKKFARMVSFAATIGLIGAIYGGRPVRYLCDLIDYKTVIGIFVVIGLGLAFITYLVIPETKASDESKGRKEDSIAADIREVFTNRKVMLICFSSGLMVGPLEGFADVWGPQFLIKSYGLEGDVASFLPSLIFFGMCFGGPLLSFIAERINSYVGTIIFSGLTMAAIFVMLIAKMLNVLAMEIGFVIVGICSAYQILAIYRASSYVSEKVVSLTTASTNMIIMIFGYAFHGLIGAAIKILGGTDADSVDMAFRYGVSLIPLTLLMGTLGFMALSRQEARHRSKGSRK
jgi:predicted MFS family arabinose efflux permease